MPLNHIPVTEFLGSDDFRLSRLVTRDEYLEKLQRQIFAQGQRFDDAWRKAGGRPIQSGLEACEILERLMPRGMQPGDAWSPEVLREGRELMRLRQKFQAARRKLDKRSGGAAR
jgi:hypothetical protein